jgi:rod shape-determining protein MreC
VRHRAGSLQRFASPFRVWAQRVPVVILVIAAVALMILGKVDTVLVRELRGLVGDVAGPVMESLSVPVARVTEAVDSVSRFADLPAQIQRLTEERNRLREWESTARRLEAENRELRKLLGFVPDPAWRTISARVVGDTGSAFFRSVLVTAGRRDGVKRDQVAMTGEGLVGRVFETGARSARVLLVTDINSRIPVEIERSGERAVLAGDNSDWLRLVYLSPDADIEPGDRVVTSGHGGIFMRGLPVGTVTAVKKGTALVRSFVVWERLSYLRLLDSGLPEALLAPVGQDRAEPR